VRSEALFPLLLVVLSCTRAESVVPPDPPIHEHPHPDIRPDDLSPAPTASPIEDSPCAHDVAKLPPAPPPRIAGGPPVTNYIPPDVIMRIVRRRAACFRACYEAGLARDPSLQGRVAIHFVVDIDGHVRTSKVRSSDLGDAAVAECAARVPIGTRFPEMEARTSVVYPIDFAPPK
jgi:hypothetical protein